MIKRHKNLFIDILLILLLGLLSITWFKGNNLISGGDFGIPFDWVKYLRSMFSVWVEDYSMGGPDYRNIASLVPYAVFGASLQCLGFSLVFIEKILFYLWFISGGLSMYFLCSVLGMKRLGKVFASVFYMLNPFSLIVIWHVSHALIQMPYAFAPLYLGLYLNGLQNSKGFKYIFFSILIWLLTTTSAYAWPAAVAIHFIPLAFYTLSFFIFHPEKRRFALKFSLIFLVTWLFFNFYWLYPFVASIKESIGEMAHSPVLMSDIDTLKLTSVKLIDGIRMFGYWALHSGYKGDPYYLYHQFYNSKYIIVLSWLVPFLVYLGFAHKEARKKVFLCFSLVVIFFGLFGMKGPHPPLGNLLVAIYQRFPPLALLTRFTFLFFGIPTYLIYAVLIGYGILFLEGIGRRYLSKFIYPFLGLMAILIFVVLVWPFWSGEVIRSESKISPGERVKVPSYWQEARNWLLEQKGFFRIFPLPMTKTYNVVYAWEKGYGGGDPIRWLLPQPSLYMYNPSMQILGLIGNLIEQERDFREVDRLLGFLGAKYLLLREDIRWENILGHQGWFAHTAENIQRFIERQKNLTLEKQFEKLSFYKIKDDYLLPRIYIPPKLALIYGAVDRLVDVTQYLHPEKREGLLFVHQNNKKDLFFPEKVFSQILISQDPVFYEESTQQLTPFVIYNFTIPKDGEYEVYLRDDSLKKYYSFSEDSLEVVLDGQKPQKMNFQSAEVNKLSLSRLNLKTGQHQLKIVLPPSLNLVADSSFEEGRWQGPADAFPEDSVAANISVSQSQDCLEGKYSLQIETAGHSPMVYTIIENFQPGDIYQLSFAAKHITGNPPYFAILENPAKTGEFNMDFSQKRFDKSTPATMLHLQGALPKDATWKSYHLIFKPKEETQRAGVVFVSYQREPGKTVNLYDAVKVERAFTNPILLRFLSESTENIVVPEVSFRKTNPSKFEVKISNAAEPYFLIFSDSYHPKWKTSIGGEHLLMNGFANGWYIDKLGNYEFSINFGPHKIYYLSCGVSLLFVFTLAGYLLFQKIRKPKDIN